MTLGQSVQYEMLDCHPPIIIEEIYEKAQIGGRYMNHGADEPEALIAPLSERALETLEYLLGKCLIRGHR